MSGSHTLYQRAFGRRYAILLRTICQLTLGGAPTVFLSVLLHLMMMR